MAPADNKSLGWTHAAEEDVISRLKELHGEASDFLGAVKPATDVYIDAAGVPAVIATALEAVKHRGVLTIIAVHKNPVPVDFLALLPTEADIRMAMGYPTEIFEVTDAIIEYQDKYATIISDLVPAADVKRGLELAGTPAATDKVVITFD